MQSLIANVSKLDKGQRIQRPERSEPSLHISEFHLVKSGICNKDAVQIQDLAKSLGKKGYHTEINKRLNAAQKKAKVLCRPLEKLAAERFKRIVGFENTSNELKKWNAIIATNRVAENIIFPLRNYLPVKIDPSTSFLKRFRMQSDLQKALAELQPNKEEVEENEEKFSMKMNEIMEKRKEAARYRAQQSYKESKAHRQKKIKSKKFHRIQKKAKIKQQLKEFEELQKSNPEAALEKLEQLDRTRAEERMSLRHKSTGQWAKNKLVRAKYDKQTRQVLAQQLSIGRDLTQKIGKEDNSDEENEDQAVFKLSSSDKENPWVNGVKSTSEIDEFINGYRKYWDEKNNNKKSHSNLTDKINIPNNDIKYSVKSSMEGENEADKKCVEEKTKTKIQKLNKSKEKCIDSNLSDRKNVKSKKVKLLAATSAWKVQSLDGDISQSELPRTENIDDMFDRMVENLPVIIENKLKQVKRKYNVDIEETNRPKKLKKKGMDSENMEFKNRKQRPVIDEAMNEVPKKKSNSLENSLSEHIANEVKANSIVGTETTHTHTDTIDPNKYITVRSKYLKSAMPDTFTGDENALDDSEDDEDHRNIVSEAFADDDVVGEFRKEKEAEVKKSQLEDIDLTLPGWGSWSSNDMKVPKRRKRRFILKFPKDAERKDQNKGDVIIFEDFEASIRAPLGRTFIPENAHKKLIEPAIKTEIGKIIEPMDEDVLLKAQNITKKRRPAKICKKLGKKLKE
ncbi:U3 small nucleolar RNA-associated protein 14 homolog A isoform X2 [Prorops nasuta]|uniref:U3 small nucleolar RNA-associated protein 14 homolog A isoform X2 n=1 Tax=Prorops nasuta TaxID=863751 RepID=UPI0034CD8973